jgi:hypothetical protein
MTRRVAATHAEVGGPARLCDFSFIGHEVGQHSNTVGNAIAISSSRTAGNRFHGDDAGNVISSGNLRNVLSRLLLTAEHTGGSLASICAQTKLYNGVDFDGSYVCGLYGYLEIAGASDFNLDSAGHAACAIRARVECAGNVNIQLADTYLAGVYAELNTTGAFTVTQTGFLAAYVACVTDQKNDKWGKVLFCKGEAADMGVHLGEHGNSAGDGISLAGATAANRFHSDDGGGALTGNRRGVLSRLAVIANHTGSLSLSAATHQTKLVGGIDFDGDYICGSYNYLEIAGTSNFTLNSAGHAACALRARVEVAGNVTVDTTDTYLAGVFAELNTTGAFTVTQTNSHLAAFAAAVTDQKNDKWGKILFCMGEAADIGVMMGEHHSTAAGDGLDLSAVTATNRFHSDDGGNVITGSNRRGVLSRLLITAVHTGGSLAAACFQTKLAGNVDFDGDYICGSYNYLEIAGTSNFGLNSAGHAACAVRARVEVAGSLSIETTGSFLCGVFAELNTTGAYTVTQTGILAAFVAITTDQRNDDWGTALYVDGADYFVKFAASPGTCAVADTGATGDNATHKLKCALGGTDFYIAGFADF